MDVFSRTWTTPSTSFSDFLFSSVLLSLIGGAFTFVLIALLHPNVRSWFYAKHADSNKAKTWTLAIVVASGILVTSHNLAACKVLESIDKLYSFNVKIVPYDVDSGEGISGISGSFPSTSNFHKNSTLRLPEIHYAMATGPNGTMLKINGLALQPFVLTIQSGGYRDASIEITRDSDSELRLPMHRNLISNTD